MTRLFKLAEILFSQKKFSEALTIFIELLKSEPDNYVIYSKIALIYQYKKDYKNAIEFYEKSLSLNNKQAGIYNNLGVIYRDIGQYQKAIECFRKDLSSYENLFNLGILFEKTGKIKEARKCYYLAIKLKPDKTFALQTKINFLLPSIYNNKNEITKSRIRIKNFINRYIDSAKKIENPIEDIGVPTFYLGYHGICNKELNSLIAKFYKKHINENIFVHYNKKPVNKKIKIGFVSSFFKKHSVSDVSNLWIAKLNKKIFEVIIFSIGEYNDESVKILKNNSTKFFSLPANIQIISKTIIEEKLNILFFTDIGMEPFTYFLAMSRFAPVQITYTGHPDTTGINTIDYYVSSKFWETDCSDSHYSEKLVRFNSLTWFYKKTEIRLKQCKNKEFFGFSKKDNIYCINQSLFKIHIDFDIVLKKILSNDKNAKIAIFYDKNHFWWKELLIKRFKATISDINRIIFIPKLKFQYYLNFLQISNVILDTIHFNGGTTSLQAFAIGTPIITLPSNLMRGRFTFGMYKKMGIDDLIAENENDYINKAITIANDLEVNSKIRKKIFSENSILFSDNNVVKEFENFFKNLI